MGTIGDLLVETAKERVNKEMSRWVIKRLSTDAWAAVSPAGESFSVKACKEDEAKNFVRTKILKEKGYAEILRGGWEAVGNH